MVWGIISRKISGICKKKRTVIIHQMRGRDRERDRKRDKGRWKEKTQMKRRGDRRWGRPGRSLGVRDLRIF